MTEDLVLCAIVYIWFVIALLWQEKEFRNGR